MERQEIIKAIGGRLRADWADSLGEQVPNRIIEAMAKLDAARAVDPLPDAQLKANIAAPPRYPRGTE